MKGNGVKGPSVSVVRKAPRAADDFGTIRTRKRALWEARGSHEEFPASEAPTRSDDAFIRPPASVALEILEPIGGKFSASGRVLNVLVTEVMLQRPCIDPLVRKFVPRCVPQHIRMHPKRCLLFTPQRSTDPFDI